MFAYILIGTLLVTIVIFAVIFRKKKISYIESMNNQALYHYTQLLAQYNDLTTHIEYHRNQLRIYQEEVVANTYRTYPIGEILLIEKFQALFEDSSWNSLVVYNGLEYKRNQKIKKVDFLAISDRGVFVIESKMWKGATYIIDDPRFDIFNAVDSFRDFGVGSSDKIRIINAKSSNDKIDKIHISSYENPIAQVRNYCMELRDILELETLRNFVVFHEGENYEILYNNIPLTTKTFDYTTLLTDKKVVGYMNSLPDQKIDPAKTIQKLDTFSFKFRIDITNFKQAPYSFVSQ